VKGGQDFGGKGRNNLGAYVVATQLATQGKKKKTETIKNNAGLDALKKA